ncbi:MAG: Gfo/Idh/MocA family protein [Actinomycetes bacterium]
MSATLPASRIPDPSVAPPLRWGVLAPGGIAAAMTEALQRRTRQRVVAVGSRNAERARAFADRWGIDRAHASYDALLADDEVDVVYVASPHSEHRDQALAALAAGKHVLVEKAFTRNAGEARDVADAARSAGRVCMEAMWTRFLPRTDIVRQVLADGVLGPVETLIADHGQWFAEDRTSRLFAPELAGGALLDLGIYPVSFAAFALGRPGRVTARGTKTVTGVDRQVSVVLDQFPGSDAHALLSTTLAARTPTGASLSGPLGRLELDGPFYGPGAVRLVTRSGEVVESEAPAIEGYNGLAFEAAHLAQLVAEGATESPLLPLSETVAILETLDEIRAQVGVRYPGESTPPSPAV